MTRFRAIAIALSLMIHASLGYAMLPRSDLRVADAFDAGSGNDTIQVEQGIAIEGLSKLGDALESIQTADITPVAQQTPPPVEDVKPVDEIRDAITATESKVEVKVTKAEETPTVADQPKPEVVQAEEQPQQVAMIAEKSSSESKNGQLNLEAQAAFRGQLSNAVQKAVRNPNSKRSGTVNVTFKIGLRGEVLSREITSTSGSKLLDQTVIAAIDSAEFPPIPANVSNEPMVVSVPFKFVTR